ncbi:MAG TPA: methyltransferase domain-containing protein [Gemmatimonadales bacterium]|jgi:ubiquinone/menaquinone biosynthesis C-methylase UbiE|nr:methyltransferase domain-containing protein [Gemmatimonadales bacterium]
MSSDNILRADAPAVRAEVPAWSEDALTARARKVWTAGDFLPIARSFAPGAEEFITRLALRPGESVLDVACGTGNLAIPAARAGARVSGIDIAPNLIAEARLEARTAGQAITFEVGDAEALPYVDDQFDTTVTMFGAMFAYRPERAAAELLRVTRPGGRVAMANWTPEGFIGKVLRAHVGVVPPPPGVPSSLEWGKEETVRARFGGGVTSLTCTRRTLELRFPFPPAAVTELFAANYGPTVTTLRATDPQGASRLRDELTSLFQQHNLATDGTTAVAGEYLDVQARVA